MAVVTMYTGPKHSLRLMKDANPGMCHHAKRPSQSNLTFAMLKQSCGTCKEEEDWAINSLLKASVVVAGCW